MKTAAEIMDADVPSLRLEDDARSAIDTLAKTDLGALLAKDVEPFAAAAAGALLHAHAGRHAAAEHGADHVIAGDVIEAIPAGMRPIGSVE